MINLCTKFQISMFIHYEDMKGNKNTEIGMVWVLGVTQGHQQHSHPIELKAHITYSYLTLIETMRPSCTVFESLSLISQNLTTSRDRDHAHSRDSL